MAGGPPWARIGIQTSAARAATAAMKSQTRTGPSRSRNRLTAFSSRASTSSAAGRGYFPQLAPSHAALDQLLPDQLLPDQLFPDQLLPDQLFPDQLFPDQLFPDQTVPSQLLPDQPLPVQMLPFHFPPDQLLAEASSFAIAAALNGWPKMSCSPLSMTPSRVR